MRISNHSIEENNVLIFMFPEQCKDSNESKPMTTIVEQRTISICTQYKAEDLVFGRVKLGDKIFTCPGRIRMVNG